MRENRQHGKRQNFTLKGQLTSGNVTSKNMDVCLHLFLKTYADWLAKLTCAFKHHFKGKKLVQCSSGSVEPTFYVLILKFDQLIYQHP